ncbi:MAG: ribonucleoside triphosphate reductase [Candidatus Wallbacteria bacterium]|nr:ribonucleoside triphosphate reductase [Candidatus Wallbacteria bacterium]
MNWGENFKIAKRNNEIVDFDQDRISNAIYKAAISVGGRNRNTAQQLSVQVTEKLKDRYPNRFVVTVEEVQDMVEKVLIENGHAKTAKAFILYRERHQKLRSIKSVALDVEKTIHEYIGKSDWRVWENSNSNFSFSGLMLHISGKVISNYLLSEIYTPALAEAHKEGYIHIHDLSSGVVGYCSGWSLKNLLIKGFGDVPNKVDAKPARHMDVVISQMVNFIGCMQMEFAGAQAFSSVDTLLAPFVRVDSLTYEQVKQNMQRMVFSLNIPSRWGSQTPFSNLTFDLTVPVDMKDEKAIVGGKEMDFTYGDCQREMDMINKAFLELLEVGDARGRIFTFPLPTYNLTKNFEWDSEIAKLLFKVTAKYGIPYFQNYIGSDLDPKSIRAMCCRLNINQLELQNRPGSMWGPGDNTGSVGVVTINVNRLAFEAHNQKQFFTLLGHYMDLSRDSLEIKRRLVAANLENGLMPYTRTYLGSFRNHFSTIGLCGMNEACINFLGHGIETAEGKKFATKTLEYMRKRIREYQEETGNLYNLEASPAESASYRFARMDREKYPQIQLSGKDAPYLTNSTQLPVDTKMELFEALEHQDDLQKLYTGGTIFHTFLGEEIEDPEVCANLVRKIAEKTHLPYFSITPTFSICRTHGYIRGEHFECPQCHEKTEVYSRIVGYFRPVSNWNAGKKEEFFDRRTFEEDIKPMIEGAGRRQAVEKAEPASSPVVPEPLIEKEIPAAVEHLTGESESRVSRIKLFYSTNCPSCYQLKSQMTRPTCPVEEWNVFTQEGLEESRRYQVMSVPTLVYLDGNEKVIKKSSKWEEAAN